MTETKAQGQPAAVESRVRRLPPFWRAVLLGATVFSVALSAYQLFNLGRYVGYVPIDTQYFYILLTALLPLAFILYPVSRRAPMDRVPLYDVALAALAVAVNLFYAYKSRDIVDLGWEYAAPDYVIYVSFVMWALVLEAARRAGGLAIFCIAGVISLYPVVADYLPGILSGHMQTFGDTAAFHALSSESVLGIPMRAFANLVIGFLIFGVALQYTGGGKFFLNLAFALLGHVRGGPAKVAIFASGLMGSMSGSVITNVLTTGVMSIPAMRRVGFARAYAGGVEACASTGGVLMPPIMGATAFVMATFLEVPYIDIAIAAIIPSTLYFFGLFMQIDAYAAKNDLKGLPRAELPSLARTLKEGWHFIAVFVLLIYMLVHLQREALAPYYATALLIAINQIFPYHRWSLTDLVNFIAGVGRLFAELAAILAGIGLIVGALAVTGKVGSIAGDLVLIAGNSPLILLLMGAITSFILGIGMTVTAAYIFLAITLAPALTGSGLSPMAVHLFMLYWGMLSYITPPVALGAYAASTLAESPPMRTGFEAMRLGSIIYFIPFFFVLNPALIMQGEWSDILQVTVSAMIGVVLLAAALQGYLFGFGDLTRHAVLGWPIRALLFVAAIMFATPGGGLIPWSNVQLATGAAMALVAAVVLAFWARRAAALGESG